jgi:hypothetical protein
VGVPVDVGCGVDVKEACKLGLATRVSMATAVGLGGRVQPDNSASTIMGSTYFIYSSNVKGLLKRVFTGSNYLIVVKIRL